jgi:nitronate monooxygenase
MWPDHRLSDLFEIEHPIVQAPMAGFATLDMAAAVCEAGGLGSIGCAAMSPEPAAQTIGELRRLTGRPINVNFFCHTPAKVDAGREQAWRERLAPYYRELGIEQKSLPRLDLTPFDDAMCEVVEHTRPEVVSFHFGVPAAALLARVKAAGCRVISSATTVEEAIWLEANGADAVIAQGTEAGGHRGTFLARNLNRAMASQSGTLALVPQIADAVTVPVIAAGGIGDGRGIAAAFALGASGVQIGTAFLRCPEAGTPPLHREALKHARDDETLLTNAFTGRPARAIASRFPLDVGLSDAAPDFPLPMGELPPLRAKTEQEQRRDFSPLWSGQAAALATEMPAKALVEKLTQDAFGRFAQLGGGSHSPRAPARA